MGCAPSLATGSSSRVSHAEDVGEFAMKTSDSVSHHQMEPVNAGNTSNKDIRGMDDGISKPRENGRAISDKVINQLTR